MMYAIYDAQKNEQCIGTFDTYKEAGDCIGLSPDAVYRAIKRDSLMKGRYKADKIEKEEL